MAGDCQPEIASVAVGKRIRELREIRGWSQAELARRVGTHRPIVGRVERGIHGQGTNTILKYAEALQVRPELIVEVIDELKILAES
jgi:transcriptional regulator with XRE-family HTH domain